MINKKSEYSTVTSKGPSISININKLPIKLICEHAGTYHIVSKSDFWATIYQLEKQLTSYQNEDDNTVLEFILDKSSWELLFERVESSTIEDELIEDIKIKFEEALPKKKSKTTKKNEN